MGFLFPIIFSIGDQTRIDEWFKRVRKPFGVMEFTATPEAVPPTLTIFVQNTVVNLGELKIPEDIDPMPNTSKSSTSILVSSSGRTDQARPCYAGRNNRCSHVTDGGSGDAKQGLTHHRGRGNAG